MWSTLPWVTTYLFIDLPLAISVFLHLHNGGSVRDVVPLTHIALRVGWRAAMPFVRTRGIHHSRRAPERRRFSFEDRAITSSKAPRPRRFRLRLTRSTAQTDLAEWRLKDRELALYQNDPQPVCPWTPPPPTDLIEWRLKDRELAMYHVFQPVCLPRPPTGVILWSLMDRELALPYVFQYVYLPSTPPETFAWKSEDTLLYIHPARSVTSVADEAMGQAGEVPRHAPRRRGALSTILWCSLVAGSGALSGVRDALAGGHSKGGASTFAEGEAIKDKAESNANHVEAINNSEGAEVTDGVNLIKVSDHETSRSRHSALLRPTYPPGHSGRPTRTKPYDRAPKLSRMIAWATLRPDTELYTIGRDPLAYPLPSTPVHTGSVFDIVPKTTLNIQTLVKAVCVTENCNVCDIDYGVRECAECQACSGRYWDLRRFKRAYNSDRFTLYIDHVLPKLELEHLFWECLRRSSNLMTAIIYVVAVVVSLVINEIEVSLLCAIAVAASLDNPDRVPVFVSMVGLYKICRCLATLGAWVWNQFRNTSTKSTVEQGGKRARDYASDVTYVESRPALPPVAQQLQRNGPRAGAKFEREPGDDTSSPKLVDSCHKARPVALRTMRVAREANDNARKPLPRTPHPRSLSTTAICVATPKILSSPRTPHTPASPSPLRMSFVSRPPSPVCTPRRLPELHFPRRADRGSSSAPAVQATTGLAISIPRAYRTPASLSPFRTSSELRPPVRNPRPLPERYFPRRPGRGNSSPAPVAKATIRRETIYSSPRTSYTPVSPSPLRTSFSPSTPSPVRTPRPLPEIYFPRRPRRGSSSPAPAVETTSSGTTSRNHKHTAGPRGDIKLLLHPAAPRH